MSSDRVSDDVFKWSEDGKPVKVDKWNATTVKNALDDAVRMIMTKHFKYDENHTLMDQRLVICTVACLFAGTALVYDYLRPFPESRLVLLVCVVSYFLLMGVLTLYTTYVERNHFLIVHQKDPAGVDPDKVWTIDSCMKRFDDMYTLSLLFEDKQNNLYQESSFTKSVGCWFDENGELVGENFLKDVAALHDGLKAEKKKK